MSAACRVVGSPVLLSKASGISEVMRPTESIEGKSVVRIPLDRPVPMMESRRACAQVLAWRIPFSVGAVSQYSGGTAAVSGSLEDASSSGAPPRVARVRRSVGVEVGGDRVVGPLAPSVGNAEGGVHSGDRSVGSKPSSALTHSLAQCAAQSVRARSHSG